MYQNAYGSSSSSSQQQQHYYGQQPATGPNLQFYAPSATDSYSSNMYASSRTSLDGNMSSVNPSGNIAPGYGGNIQATGPWWTAFGTGGFEGEPPLLEELGINFAHIQYKSLTVLNPLRHVDERIMDDADLAGPLLFFLLFGVSLLFSGRPHFGYIYGVGLLGSASIYSLLNLMSEAGIDAYRVVSVLGYCLLPMVGVGLISVIVTLDQMAGFILSLVSIVWCTYAASAIFVAVLRMHDQRLLVAYPIGLLYGCFAMLSVFSVGSSALSKTG